MEYFSHEKSFKGRLQLWLVSNQKTSEFSFVFVDVNVLKYTQRLSLSCAQHRRESDLVSSVHLQTDERVRMGEYDFL